MFDNSEATDGVGSESADSGVSPSWSSSSNASLRAWTSLVSDDQNELATYLRMEGAVVDTPIAFCGVKSGDVVSGSAEDCVVLASPLRLNTKFSNLEIRFLSSLSTPRLPACRALCLRVLAVHARFDLVHWPHG